MKGIGHPDRARAPLGDDGVDEVGPISGNVGDLGAALFAEQVEELVDRGAGASRCCPHQPAGVVVDDDHQVPVSLLVGDLIDPDPPQPGQPVVLGLDVVPDSGDDRPDRAPRDPHQLRRGALRGPRGQPGDLVIEGQRMTGVVASPWDMRHDDTMGRAAHPGRVGFHHRDRRAQIQRPPPPPPRPRVVARTAASTPPAPAPLPAHRPRVSDQHQRVLVVLDPLDHRLLDPEQTPP